MDLAPKRLTKQSFKQFAGEHPSVLPLKSPDIWSAIVSNPGMWLEKIQKPLFCANSHICFAISLQRTECMPPKLLMYANAVLLPVKIWTCLTLQLYLKYDFSGNKIAFSSRAIIFLSKELHLSPIGVHTFFINNAFFNSEAVLLNFFLTCLRFNYCLWCLIHASITITRHIFTTFVFMSRPRSIYVAPIWSIFHFHLHFHYV